MYYKEVKINSVDDLPQDEGEYFINYKHGNRVGIMPYNGYKSNSRWMNVISSYLIPVPEGVLYTDQQVRETIIEMFDGDTVHSIESRADMVAYINNYPLQTLLGSYKEKSEKWKEFIMAQPKNNI